MWCGWAIKQNWLEHIYLKNLLFHLTRVSIWVSETLSFHSIHFYTFTRWKKLLSKWISICFFTSIRSSRIYISVTCFFMHKETTENVSKCESFQLFHIISHFQIFSLNIVVFKDIFEKPWPVCWYMIVPRYSSRERANDENCNVSPSNKRWVSSTHWRKTFHCECD